MHTISSSHRSKPSTPQQAATRAVFTREQRPLSSWNPFGPFRPARPPRPHTPLWWLLPVLVLLSCSPETTQTLPPANASQRFPIQPAETCRTCHPSQYEQWQGSLMAYMAVSPFFNGLEISIQELIGRHRDGCVGGAGVLRRADPLLSESCTNPVDPDGEGPAPPEELKITGAGGEHWCVNCHVMGENTYRQYIPPNEQTPLVPGVPTWKKSDPDSRRPLVELLRHQTHASLKGTALEGTEGRTMLQGASCDGCHQVVHPVRSTQQKLDEANGLTTLLDQTLQSDQYTGNPFWTSFTDLELGTEPSLCLQTGENGEPLSAVGAPCKQLFRDEAVEGLGISNSGYFLDPQAIPPGQAPNTAGSWKFGPRMDPAPLSSAYHESSHAPVQLDSAVQVAAASVDDPRYALPGDRQNADYFRTSEFCGTCHDVRIIGTDARKHLGCREQPDQPDCFQDPFLGASDASFEAHKRLRDAYSEWFKSDYARIRQDALNPSVDRLRSGDSVVTCQDCHMSTYPVFFDQGTQALADDCELLGEQQLPPGMRAFEDKLTELASRANATPRLVKPGCYPLAKAADDHTQGEPAPTRRVSTHYFTGADVPIEPLFNEDQFLKTFDNEVSVDGHGMIKSLLHRRDLLLKRSVSFQLTAGQTLNLSPLSEQDRRPSVSLELVIENVGAGHRIPAGFTQEREVWVELALVDLGLNPDFRCGTDQILEQVQAPEHYPRVSRCVSQLRFGEALDSDCAALLGSGPVSQDSLEQALAVERERLGMLAHVGALVDQDHDELVLGQGPGSYLIAPAGLGASVLLIDDRLDYQAVQGLFDAETGALQAQAVQSVRAGDNRIFLLDRITDDNGSVFYAPLLGLITSPAQVQGEIRLIERADGVIVDEDITDKRFSRIRINDEFFDGKGGGLIATYAGDLFDGPDKPLLHTFTVAEDGLRADIDQEGLINFQNGFLTCVACCPAGTTFGVPLGGSEPTCLREGKPISPEEIPINLEAGACCRGDFVDGVCQEDRQRFPKAWNMVQGLIDLEDGICRSNLVDEAGQELISRETQRPGKLLEVFSPIEGLTADTGAFKAADAIINERSLPPGVPFYYRDRLPLQQVPTGDLCVEARLNFRAFPPYELRMFAGRELLRLAEGERQAPTMSLGMVDRLDVVVMGLDSLRCLQQTDQSWSCFATEDSTRP